MRPLFVLVALMATLAFARTRQQSDSDGIKATIKDYIEGYYTGNADRVKSALHPMLAKRYVAKKKTGGEVLVDGTAQHMVEMTAAQDGPKYYKKGQQRLEIKIFEIGKNIASAKATAQDWIDYLHLAKIEGKWVIVNVVWAETPPPK